MKKHCSDFDDNGTCQIPSPIWKKFGSMWDKCSTKFVKRTMENMYDQNERTDDGKRRVYRLALALSADQSSDELCGEERTFWKWELPEVFAHLCKKRSAKVLEVTIVKVHRSHNDASVREVREKIEKELYYEGRCSKWVKIEFHTNDVQINGDFDEEKAASEDWKSHCSNVISNFYY